MRLIIAIALIEVIGLTVIDIISCVDTAKSRTDFCASAVRNATACEKTRQLGIQNKVRDITNGLGLPDGASYDYILLLEVIEHTAYPHRILNDAVNHAKKGVIVSIPNSAYIKWRIQMLRGYVPRQSFTHLHFWSVKIFEIFCKEANIQILEFKTFLPRHLMPFQNLLAWQQCWMLSPKKKEV